MAAQGYEFYLLVFASLTRERYFQHEKIKFVSPCGHVMSSMSVILYQIILLRDFSEYSWRLLVLIIQDVVCNQVCVESEEQHLLSNVFKALYLGDWPSYLGLNTRNTIRIRYLTRQHYQCFQCATTPCNELHRIQSFQQSVEKPS